MRILHILAVACTLLCAHAQGQAAGLDLATLTQLNNNQATPLATFKSYNRGTKESLYQIALTNVSGGTLHGPMYATIEGLTPAAVTLKNPSGVTTTGVPYFVMSEADLAAGATATVPAVFANPQNVRFNFTMSAYATPNAQTPPLTIEITHPGTLITVGSTPLVLDGVVNDNNATVTVNGAPVSVSGGTFHANVELREGHNAIVARAVNGRNEEATATISVSLDLTPPYVTIDSPSEGAVLTSALVNVAGLINDIVRGTVSEGQANVTVNGRPASVANRSYFAQDIPLAEGPNTIRVQAADQVGNVGVTEVHVTYEVPTEPFIEAAGGQAQQAQIRQVLPQSLQARLVTADGQPVPGKSVIFRVTQGDGRVGIGAADAGIAVLVSTDQNGIASTRYQLGSRAGSGNNHVSAKAVGFDGEVLFVASATPLPGNKVSVNSGNNQRGAANQPLPLPFVVVVMDDGANVIEGAQIEFVVTTGSGTFQDGQTHFTATTDSDGRANAKLTLGNELGLDAQRVTATLAGTALSAGFTASALQSGPPGATSISGVVLDNQDHPLPNVTMRVEDTTRQAVTDEQGRFKITEAPVGPLHLIADGSTTTVPGEWPTLPYNIVTVAGADNPLPSPVYLVKLDTTHSVTVGAQDKVITLPEVPGFKLTVKAGSVTFPNSDRVGQLSVTPVNVAKIPMAPPNGMQPQFIVTIQPTGARFDPPAPLQLPNVDGHPPGAQVEMYSFDHDLEEFVAIGLGTVSADGTVIASNAGVGVIKAGWHCGSQPGGSGCAASCPICQAPNSACSTCVANNGDVRVTSRDQFDDCQKPACSNGSLVQVPDPTDDPPDAIGNDCHKSTCAGLLAVDDTDLPVDICKTCKNGETVDAGPGDAKLTDVRAVVEGIDEKWKLLRNGSATFQFTGNSTRVQCADVKYEWDFGDPLDPTPKTGQFVSHTYRQADQYTVTVKVTCQTCGGQLTQTDTAKVVALEISHVAAAEVVPDNPERTKLGVGEHLLLTTVPQVKLNWSVTGGGTLQPDPSCTPPACVGDQIFVAGAIKSSPGLFISAPPMLESTLALELSVIPPERLRWTRVEGVTEFHDGEAGASMTLRPILDPKDVSFAALEFREESGPAINMTGFFATLDPKVPMNQGGMFHVAGTQYARVNNAQDLASHGPFPKEPGEDHWLPGSYDLLIPNTYRIIGETETHFLDTVSVHLDLDENGRVIMTKSQACVARENFSTDVSSTFCIPEPPQ